MKGKILVVDDDEDILYIFDIALSHEGYHPILINRAIDSEEVLSLMPDLIFLDVMISGTEKTGLEICRSLKDDAGTARIPVLLISAERDLSLLAEGCGADGYISKPFDLANVLKKAASYLRKN
ncbi:response regulator [Pedobacter faecalis]|uniref:response regulator n=1 Tax=Pedobacter faecalis TaxID=3041495 RepID=UPI00255123F0|nr:response regulator [Pedobacter sp. ELA7]